MFLSKPLWTYLLRQLNPLPKTPPRAHLERQEALVEIGGRTSPICTPWLRTVFTRGGHYEQKLSPLQEATIDRTKATVEKELAPE